MSEIYVSKEAVKIYRSYGDERPSGTDLTELEYAINGHVRGVSASMAYVDVLLDFSVVEPKYSRRAISVAGAVLDEVIVSSNNNKSSQSHYVIKALQKKSELHIWEQIASGASHVEADYLTLLEGALGAVNLARHLDSTDADGYLTEIVPVLLSQRSIDPAKKWLARTSMLREDSRMAGEGDTISKDDQRYSNWDIGVSRGNSADEFMNPQNKVQIKTRDFDEERSAYQRKGVRVLSSMQARFYKPSEIIEMCEAELPVVAEVGPDNYVSRYLDVVTGHIMRACFAPLPDGDETETNISDPAAQVAVSV